MTLTFGQTGTGKSAESSIIDATTASFETDVLRASRELPVIVDFWAPWCGPCKQLTPLLEKLVLAAKGKVRLAKINIDEAPELAQALRIQSVPTVYAFLDGRPVDAFQGAVPESQLKQFIDRLIKHAGSPDAALEEALAQAKQAEDEGDWQSAAAIYDAVLEAEPEHPAAHAGLLRAALAAGRVEEAKARLDSLPEALQRDPLIVAVRSSIDLAEQASHAGPLGDLEAKVASDPADQQARLDLALGLYAASQFDRAIEVLLDSVKRDRAWNDGEARKQLVKFFEAFGPTDPRTVAGRRRLSSILFS